MQTLRYTITDPLGLHARSAGLLVKEAARWTCEITISCGEKHANCKHIFAIMGMAVKQGAEVTITCEGTDEEQAKDSLLQFFEKTL